ncbi:hypothetical protein Tco_0756822 [Tanacetum coccineum]
MASCSSHCGRAHVVSWHLGQLSLDMSVVSILQRHRRNEGISSNSSLLSGGSSTVPQCLSEEYEDYLRRSHEDFKPLPRIFTPEEPGALYKNYLHKNYLHTFQSSYSSERHWGTVELPPLSKELLLLIPSFLLCILQNKDISRLNCPKCQLTTCALCARNYLGKTINVKRKQPQKSKEEKDFSNNKVKLLKELLKEKTEQVQQMIRDQAKEYYENKAAMQKKEKIWQSKESLLVRDLTDAFKIIDQLRIEKERLEEQKDEEIRKLKALLQKKEEEAEA